MTAGLWIAVGLIGGAATVGRFMVDAVVSARLGASGFPLGTFVVNVSGAFALGLIVGLAVRGDALLLAGTAALGSYTTFSTWMLEAHRLGEDGRGGLLALNVALSLVAGFGAAALGRAIGAAL